MKNTIKQISLMVFGSAAWMVCAVALPMSQATDTDGLMAKASNLLIGQAYAKDDESKSDDEGKSDDKSKSDDEDKSKDNSSSSSYDFSSATLVCVSKTSVETTLGITSSSDESKSDDDKSKNDESKSDDDSSKSSDDNSKSDGAKVTLCHVPNGNNSNPQTLSVASSAVDSHLNEHAGDYLGACGSSDEDKSKSDDDKSKSDDDKSKDSESESSESTSTTVDALATCTALGQDGSELGVWVPATAVGDSAALTAYIEEVQVGGSTPSTPESSLESYREIRGE